MALRSFQPFLGQVQSSPDKFKLRVLQVTYKCESFGHTGSLMVVNLHLLESATLCNPTPMLQVAIHAPDVNAM